MNDSTGGIFTLGEARAEESESPFSSEYPVAEYPSPDRIGEDVALGERESEADRPAGSGTLTVPSLPLLRSHVGSPPDLVLSWNALAAGQPADVVVHLHGFSGRGRAMRLTSDMVQYSGLDLHDPTDPSTTGRSGPTLLVLPRGHFFGGRSGHGYTFPALHEPGALVRLVDDAVARVAAHTGTPFTRGRLILTAHSGGGASMMRILRHTDVDEVHSFDALYTNPASLIAWARRRITSGSGAMRVLYRPDEGTSANSRAVRSAVSRALSASGNRLQPRFRVEATTVAHQQIPRRFGWRLLADVAADLPGVVRPPVTTRPGEAFESQRYDQGEAFDQPEAGCGCGARHEEAAAATTRTAARPRKPLTTSQVRRAWARYACAEREMVTVKVLSHRTPVNPLTVAAFTALAQALAGTDYKARKTWVYNCRDIQQTTPGAASQRSLHAYGLAVDIDPRTNPHRRKVHGPIQFSSQTTQDGREADVRAGRAGTAFTQAQVEAVEAIRTVDGLPVFGWGGRWRSSHDAMHFEIRLTPAELAVGIAARPAASTAGEAFGSRTCEAYERDEEEEFESQSPDNFLERYEKDYQEEFLDEEGLDEYQAAGGYESLDEDLDQYETVNHESLDQYESMDQQESLDQSESLDQQEFFDQYESLDQNESLDQYADQYAELDRYENAGRYEGHDEAKTAADVVAPFRAGPYQLPLNMVDENLTSCASRAESDPDVKDLCGAVVDVTGDPALPGFYALNPVDMLYVGSLAKLYVMYVAYELKHRVEAQAKQMIADGLSTTDPGWPDKVFAALKRGWQPKLDAAFKGLPSQFPRLRDIVTLAPTGKASFASDNLTVAQLDTIGLHGAPRGRFRDWMRLMMRWSNNEAASRCILALSYPYLNGALAAGGFFQRAKPGSRAGVGLWVSGDYLGHDWLSANRAGQALTPRWAAAQGRESSNFTGTSFQVARLLTLLAQGRLVDADSSTDMQSIMTATEGGVGSYLRHGLSHATPPRRVSSYKSKIGLGDDGFSHDGAVLRVTPRPPAGPNVKYVSVVLGSPPRKRRQDLDKLAVQFHDCIIARHPEVGP